MNVGIVGKGCIAKCLAHSLKSKALGHRPSFLVKPSSFQALESEGMIDANQCSVTYHPLDENKAAESSSISIFPISECQSMPSFDALVVATKSFQVVPALLELDRAGVCAEGQSIILLHNGVLSTSAMPGFIKSKGIELVFGATSHASTAFADDGPFTVRQTGLGRTWLGFRDIFRSDAVDKAALCAILDSAFATTEWFEDMEPHLLLKLAINCCINPLTAMYQIRNDALIGNAKFQSEMKRICAEICRVFGAYYHDIRSEGMDEDSTRAWQTVCELDELWDIVGRCLQDVKLNYSSMNRDIHFQRQTEVEQINGYVVDLGKHYNVEVSFNEFVVQSIREKENAYFC